MEIVAEKVLANSIDKMFLEQQKKAQLLKLEPISARKERLEALRNWVLTNRKAIQQAVYADFKKPAGEVDSTEIFHVLAEIKLALSKIDEWTAKEKIDAPLTFVGTRSYVQAEPKGTCLIISPWNYPFSLAAGPLVSALAAGNTIVLKPSEFTPNTSALLSKMVADLFVASIAFVVLGDASVSKVLTALPFDHIFFTGSPAVGKLIMKAAAENLTSVTLELGGKSPAIVTASARIEEAAERIVVAKFINCGQTCIAPDYILADAAIADRLATALTEKINKRFKEKSESLRTSQHYARIVSKKHWLRMNALLEDTLEKGAKIISGGEVNENDLFFAPTVLQNVSPGSKVMEEEIFGPLLPIITYASLADALSIINSKPKPLALYVYSQSRNEQQKIISATSSGAVCINESAIHFLHHNLPFGGVNNSGIGSTHGHYGFLAFSHLKPVMKQRNGLTSVKPLYPPYTPFVKRAMDWLFKLY